MMCRHYQIIVHAAYLYKTFKLCLWSNFTFNQAQKEGLFLSILMSMDLLFAEDTTGFPTKKVWIKNFLIRAAHSFNSQFLNLFGFSIPVSVSFVWCII